MTQLQFAYPDCLPFAILLTICFWIEHGDELPFPRHRIDEDWFSSFVLEWGVARTIKKGEGGKVLRFLNKHVQEIRGSTNPASLVDELAAEARTCFKTGYNVLNG